MPNIMLTYRCNLHCSYCFANEFVNKDNTDITIKNFLKAVQFITNTGKANIGLIGGEPTLHPGFQLIMEMLIANPKVEHVSLYTNGLLMERFLTQITHPKVGILVNCNSPYIIGEKAFDHMCQNLDLAMEHEGMRDRLKLGINLYSDDMDYSYMIELLKRYDQHVVRFSLTVPNFSNCARISSLEYFTKRKDFLLGFLKKMESINVLPYYDCNRPPKCIWTDDEKKWLESFVAEYPDEESDLIGHRSICYPVIDILPNLYAVRCFGMSDYTKVPIEEFKNIYDLRSYFQNIIDSNAHKILTCADCKDCYEKKIGQCVPGCMGFIASRIHSCNEAIEQI